MESRVRGNPHARFGAGEKAAIASKPYLLLYTAASMLLLALCFYLWYEAPEDEKNFPMVMEMLRAGEVREEMCIRDRSEPYQSRCGYCHSSVNDGTAVFLSSETDGIRH